MKKITQKYSYKYYDFTIIRGYVSTIFGNKNPGMIDDYGTNATFNNPYSIIKHENSLFVTDIGNNRIRELNLNTGFVKTISGSGDYGMFQNGNGTNAKFNKPIGITNIDNDLYVCDCNNGLIRKLQPISNKIEMLLNPAGSTGPIGPTGEISVEINSPPNNLQDIGKIIINGSDMYISTGSEWYKIQGLQEVV